MGKFLCFAIYSFHYQASCEDPDQTLWMPIRAVKLHMLHCTFSCARPKKSTCTDSNLSGA